MVNINAAATQLCNPRSTVPSHSQFLQSPAARSSAFFCSSSSSSLPASLLPKQNTNPSHYSSRRTHSLTLKAQAASTTEAPPAHAPGAITDHGLQIWQGKRLQVISAPVAEDTITIRCLDWDRDRFDIEFG